MLVQSAASGPKANRSLRQFARMAGVSPATVSRVFSGSTLVASQTRDRVLQLAESCAFRPTAINRVPFGGRTNSVGVMVPTLRVSYYATFTDGLQQRLLEADILPLIVQSSIDTDRRGVRRLLDHRVDAMVLSLVDESLHRDDFDEVLRAGVPVLLLGQVQAGFQCDTVASDDVMGGKLAGRHLLDLGHKHFGFCHYGAGKSTCEDRLSGFVEVLATRGIELPARDIAHINPIPAVQSTGVEQLKTILRRRSRPTAIFAPTDLQAREVYQAARELRLSIPRDLSVVGYADLDFAPYMDPPLTTIRQDGIALGMAAGDLLLRRLADLDSPYRDVKLPTELVLRGSTAAPSRG